MATTADAAEADDAGASLLRHAYLFAAFLLITGFGAAAALLPVAPASPDMVNALVPWMKAVRAGGLDSISGEFAIYTPPYVYLLYLANWLVPLVGEVTAISLGALRLTPGPRTNLLIATLCAGLMPYLLPKMHDRYFFVADVLTIAFAFAFRRYWVAAALFQVGSLVTYLRYFGLSHEAPAFGFLPVTMGVCTLMLAFIEMQRQAGGITAARYGRRAWGKVLPSSPGS